MDHYNPKHSVRHQTYLFYTYTQASIASYVVALCIFPLHWEYREKLSEMLSDDRAYFLALRVEVSEKDSKTVMEQEVNTTDAKEHKLKYINSQFQTG